MKIERLTVKNFRVFRDFAIDLKGNSVFVIGECAIGKTGLLVAIARGLGRDHRAFAKPDFADLDEAIEIEITLSGLNAEQEAIFCDRIDFKSKTLRIGVRVTWDANEQAPTVEHGYPEKDWAKSSVEERDAIPLHWLPADRDFPRMLQFGLRRNLIGKLVEQMPLEDEVSQAIAGLKEAGTKLGEAVSIRELLRACQQALAQLVPDVSKNIFDIDVSASTELEVLRQLELMVAHHGQQIPLNQQSSGLIQLVGYTFLSHLLKQEKGALLLIDQPENSLHPQPQRAFVNSFQCLECQTIITTHSSSILDRVDPRRILRLHRLNQGVHASQPSRLSNEEARKLSRFTTSQTAEAFFAKSVVLVEGISDLFALRALAQRNGRDLDSEGVTIVDMEGAGGLDTFLKLLGPDGFKLRIAGLCDCDKEPQWAQIVMQAKLCRGTTRTDLNNAGFFVCDRDLEDELIRAHGITDMLKLIDEEGETNAFTKFCVQPDQKGKTQVEQLRSFMGKKGRKVRYAPLVIDRLPLAKVPSPLSGVLSNV